MIHLFQNGYAVIIGVDGNQLPRLVLPTVARDVQALYNVLTHPERCGYPAAHVRLLRGTEATQQNIFEALYWLQERLQADPEATAVVYYSGHGMLDPAANQYYLIPYNIRSLQRVRADAIKAESFAAEITALQPQRLLLILDCCHAAGMDAKALELETAAPLLTPQAFPEDLPELKTVPAYDPEGKVLHPLAEGTGRAILNSSTGAESSYIRRDGKMSLFTYHLSEALTGHAPHAAGDTTVLVTDVMSYVTRRVAETARAEGRQQTPMMRTTGVFPVALLLGGEGVAKGASPPDPLEPLPPLPAAMQVTVEGDGAAAVGHGATAVGERGVYVGGNVGGSINTGDTTVFNQEGQTVHGDQTDIGRADHIGHIGDNIQVGDISDSEGIAIGRGARSDVKKGKG